MRLITAGENSLMLYLGEETSAAVSGLVQAAAIAIEASLGDLMIDLVPSYASLLIIYDPIKTDHYAVSAQVRKITEKLQDNALPPGKTVSLPVYYSPESGEDLEDLALRAQLSVEEVIRLHCSTEYRVYAIGFAPGFAYLGEVDARIAAPRLATPRQKVPRGAVAIADRQTAVYPAQSPGGWNLVGRCPTRMFNPDSDPIMPVSVGDTVKFDPIDRDQFMAMGGTLE
ncbi:MAG: KipI family sensor histidine kinase inhibitor [Halioglobus sp.]|jgi:KipI family sensor histidine kinase inhibitor